jgi:replicative DNA helicase
MFPELHTDKLLKLSAELFADETHRQMFKAILTTYRKHGTIDTGLLLPNCPTELREEICKCSDLVFKTTPFEEHYKVLMECAAKRFLTEEYEKAILGDSLTPQHMMQVAELAQKAFSTDNEQRSNIYIEYLKQLDKPRNTMRTYFPTLDNCTGGLQRGTLAIIGARPSVGKTTLALNMATHMALNGKRVMFYSLEMTGKMIIDKVVSSECNIPYTCFKGRLSKADKELVSSFLNNGALKDNLKIIDNTNTIEAICSGIMSGKPDVVVIDYVQIIRTMKGFTGDNKRLQIDYISAELKSIAKRTGCCVILLSQLKRTEKVEQPTMADLKESGGLEQDGDYIFMLYRPYAQDKSAGYNPETTTLFIEKNKFGEVGRISLKFNGRYQRFTEV